MIKGSRFLLCFYLLTQLTTLGFCQMNTTHTIISSAPHAKKIPFKHSEHGQTRIDNYNWLRDDSRKNPEVIRYLNQENSYTDAILSNEKPLIEKIYNEIVDRLPANEQSVPSKIDDYWYYSRYVASKEYSIYARKKSSLSADEEIMVDMNVRAKDHSYFDSNYQAISPNHEIMGFSEDITGRRKYSLHFKNLKTGEMYNDVINDTTGTIVWALDNKTIFYTKKHPTTLLAYRVYRHELGSKDVLVYEEKDNTFSIAIRATASKNFILLDASSTMNSETFILDAAQPKEQFKSFLPREKDHEYSVEELNGQFYILTNWQAKNFRIMHTDLLHSSDKSQWNEVIKHDNTTLLYGLIAFKDYLAIEQRTDGIRHIEIYDIKSQKSVMIKSDENAYTMWLDFNPQQNTDVLRYSYASMTTPYSVFDYNMKTAEKKLLKRDEVIGSFKSEEYVSKRINIKARDGVEVPVSLVYKKSSEHLGLRPLLIYGYGSYGISVDPTFSYSRISLLDRGFIFAIAHIRGSQAKGRSWYEDGKLLKKKNTFTDFIDVTEGLVAQGYGDKSNIFAVGGSAGGLLMGAVANMDGMLYKGMIAAVPFVDVVTTMLDEDIPLTTGEFDEWGNPKDKK